ncbi:hypothetical protein OAR80_03715 [Methylophilaceae bacterium]|nr:hypothetical protein [Methylophilaceae bacterium]
MKILLFSLLSFFCILAHADWIKLNQNQAMDTAYFIDLKNIKGNTEKVRIWTLTDYTNIQVTKKINYQSIKSFVEINCQSKKMRILAYSLYEKPMAMGKMVFSKGRPFEWEEVKPSTVNGLFLNVSCSQIEID